MTWSGILAELVETRQSDRQLAQYAAVAAALRRALDDWVPADRFPQFRALMTRLGLVVEVDCVFAPLAEDVRPVGSEYAPTTRAAAAPYPDGATLAPGSRLHVVVSSRGEWAADALAAAWYSVAVHGRVLRKPLIDHARMGHALGYPSCCVAFFLRHNDWARQNTLAEAARRSNSFRWETNCLTKLRPWMLSFHMPCAFDCDETIRHAQRVLKAVRAWDRRFAEEIVAFMRRPCFALSERFACALEEVHAADGLIRYRRIEDLCAGAPNRRPDDDARAAILAVGDTLSIDGGTVFVRRGSRLTDAFEAKADLEIVEVPLFLPFA